MTTDAEGDIEMTVPQPVFEVVQPPSLNAWDQASLVSWVRQLRQYEAKLRNRCAVTGEEYDHIVTSIRNSIEPRILDHLARFVLKKQPSAVTDEDFGLAITRRCSSLQNSHIPDMDQLFSEHLHMDLQIEDTEARILNYFVLFDRIIEEHGLRGILGSGREDETTYGERMKLRCKELLKHIALEMLKLEMERLVIARPVLKKDDIALYEALVERAREQQHYHMLAKELKADKTRGQSMPSQSSKKSPPTKQPASNKPRMRQPAELASSKSPSTKQGLPIKKEIVRTRAPPRDGCLVCGGAHWVKDCHTASDADKEAALQRMNDMKNQRLRAKAVRSLGPLGERVAIVNEVLEVPFRPDTGADCNVITKNMIQELEKASGSAVSVEMLAVPVKVEVADGRVVECLEKCDLDVQLLTAAGPVRLRRLEWIVMDGEADELLVGDETLKSLEINVDQMLEQLAAKVEHEGGSDDIVEDDIVGVINPEEIESCIDDMIRTAVENGFPQDFVNSLHDLVRRELDSWRTKLGADPPAKLEP